ncbi:MAG: ribosome hibernation-promoting factor, HPF/YfiA family [Noviherbaspirillum sp.]
MNLTISGHHVELTPSIREYVQNKLERIKHHFDYVIDVTVILAVDKLSNKEKRQRAEINLRVRGKDLHAESIAQDLYAAIDTLIDKLDRQLVKYKSKLKDHQHNGIKKIEGEASETEAPEAPDMEAPDAEATDTAARA